MPIPDMMVMAVRFARAESTTDLARSRTYVRNRSNFSNSRASRLLQDHNQPQGLHNHAVCRIGKDMRTVAHTHLMHNSSIITIQSLQGFKQ